MSSKCILVSNTHSLLIEGVKSLLDTMGNFVVSCALFTDDIALVQEIQQSKPDIVIVDDETMNSITSVKLLEMFRMMPSLRLIVLDRQISRMDVYEKHEFIISHSDHLIEALI